MKPAPSTSMVDLEIGRAVEGPVWLHRFNEPKTRRTMVWFKIAMITGAVSLPFYYGLCSKYEPYLRDKPWFTLVLLNSVSLVFNAFLFYITFVRDRIPYVLRRSQKLSIESALVVVSSCWTFYERDGDILTAILGLILLFKAIPVMNLWWDFENFDSLDCYLTLLIDAVLVCFRYFVGVALIVVTGIGVALHFIKDAYRHYSSQKIKNETQKHLI